MTSRKYFFLLSVCQVTSMYEFVVCMYMMISISATRDETKTIFAKRT